MTSFALATEDELSEAVGLKLLSEHLSLIESPPLLLRKQGFGYLRSRMESWRQMAENQVVIVLSDLDRVDCPLTLLESWLGKERKHPNNLLLRIAEREIESWLLADHDALKKLLGSKTKCPLLPDTLPDPKQHLLHLAKKAPRRVRDDLLPARGVATIQGIGYNRCLVEWVGNEWSPERAADRSPSLMRARRAIRGIADQVLKTQS